MPRINPQLLERLKKQLDVGTQRIYAIIANKASQSRLDRHLAALVVATENGVNIHKFSTPEERAQIRGIPGIPDSIRSFANSAAAQPARRPVRPRKITKISKTKDNSVFVVHGRNDKLRRSLFDFLRALGLKPLEWEK